MGVASSGGDGRRRSARLLSLGVLVLSIALALAAALPAVWWEPLHVDEAVTLDYAPRPLGTMLHDVFIERGGAPAHFLLLHLTLSWPGGLVGLRVPSLVLFVLALCAALLAFGLLARRAERSSAVLLLATAPLAIPLATFARMYTLFLLVVLIALAACVHAGRSGGRRDWVVAGLACGVSVYVHPIAPLYVALAFATGILWSSQPIRPAVRAALPGIGVSLAVAVPYVYALAVLRSKYGVALGSAAPRATAGRSVAEESLRAFAPVGLAGAGLFFVLALVGLADLARDTPRRALALAAWLVVPVVFFTVVPASDARFYPRYLLPALPVFLLTVAIGCFALARRVRRGTLLGAALVALLVAVQVHAATTRLGELRDDRLGELTEAVAVYPAGSILFGSTGTSRSDRPPELLDSYLGLRVDHLRRIDELPAVDPRYEPDVEERGVDVLRKFLQTGGQADGIWVFSGLSRRVSRAEQLLRRRDDVVVQRIGPNALVVASKTPRARRELIRLGSALREAWALPVRRDDLVRMIIRVDRDALETAR